MYIDALGSYRFSPFANYKLYRYTSSFESVLLTRVGDQTVASPPTRVDVPTSSLIGEGDFFFVSLKVYPHFRNPTHMVLSALSSSW